MTDADPRKSQIARAEILTSTREEIWARSAGRCAMCARLVLNQRSFFHTVLVGELAHNVGASNTAGSPRGESSNLSETERSSAANLLLLCHDCHRMVDAPAYRDLYTEERLRQLKQNHEERVAKATNFEVMRRTLVISTRARIRGTGVHATDREIAESMVSSNLQPHVRDGEVVRITLGLRDDENEPWVWARARKRIDEGIERLGREAGEGAIDHVSVFALAPIPILAYLGSRLDDKMTVETFERRRITATDVWCWEEHGTDVTFEGVPDEPDTAATDVVAVVSVSGTVDEHRIPPHLQAAPRVALRPAGTTPRLGIISTRASRDSVQRAWLDLLGQVEQRWPHARVLHVLGAIPLSLAVFVGQARARRVHPPFVVYQRDDNGAYQPTPPIED